MIVRVKCIKTCYLLMYSLATYLPHLLEEEFLLHQIETTAKQSVCSQFLITFVSIHIIIHPEYYEKISSVF